MVEITKFKHYPLYNITQRDKYILHIFNSYPLINDLLTFYSAPNPTLIFD